MHAVDMSGKRVGRLLVLSRAVSVQGKARWSCQCDCGIALEISGDKLRTGTQSCGCLRRELTIKRNYRHGKAKTRTYITWAHMMQRCLNPKVQNYGNYGGRGISVAPRWLSFENFLADMGEKPTGLSLDRINVNGNYEPGNCRWATYEQQVNNKRGNRYVEYKGERLTVSQWARRMGLTVGTVKSRLARWPVEKALGMPRQKFRGIGVKTLEIQRRKAAKGPEVIR